MPVIDWTRLAAVRPGDELVIVMSPHARLSLSRILSLCDDLVLSLSPEHIETIRAAHEDERIWAGAANRTHTLVAGPNWDASEFERRLSADNALASLKVPGRR